MGYEQSKSLAMRDVYIDSDNIYFSNHTFNALICMNRINGSMKYIRSFDGNVPWMKGIHRKVIKYNNSLYFVPNEGSGISKYNLITKEMEFYKSHELFLTLSDAVLFENTLYLIPRSLQQPLYLFDMDKCIFIKKSSWNLKIRAEFVGTEELQTVKACIAGKIIWILLKQENALIETFLNLECSLHYIKKDFLIHDIETDGENLLLLSQVNDEVALWNKNLGFLDRYLLSAYRKNNTVRDSGCIAYLKGKILLLPEKGNELLIVKSSGEIDSIEIPYICRVDDKARKFMPLFGGCTIYEKDIYLLPWAADKLYKINLDTYDINSFDMTFKDVECYYQNIVLVSEMCKDNKPILEAAEFYHEGKYQNINLNDLINILENNLWENSIDVSKKNYGNDIYYLLKDDIGITRHKGKG